MSNVNLIPLQSIVVHRDGSFKTPELNKPFSFTSDEVKDLQEGVHYRKPVVEVSAPASSENDQQADSKPAAKADSKPAAKPDAKGKKGSDESL